MDAKGRDDAVLKRAMTGAVWFQTLVAPDGVMMHPVRPHLDCAGSPAWGVTLTFRTRADALALSGALASLAIEVARVATLIPEEGEPSR